jgi:hypothetical protein
VYSTCSLNPIENEAVVAEVLRSGNEFTESSASGPCLELLDIHSEPHCLTGLKGRKGVKTWDVLVEKEDGPAARNPEKTPYKVEDLFTIYKEYTDDLETVKRGKIRRSMFPLPEAEMDKMNIERCFRVMPHDQDTGGFFVTVIKKNSFVYFTQKGASNAKANIEKSKQTDLAYEAIAENGKKTISTTPEEPAEDGEITENAPEKPEFERVIKINKNNHEYFKFAETVPDHWEGIKTYYDLKDDTIKDLLYIHKVGEKQVTLVSKQIDHLFSNDDRF